MGVKGLRGVHTPHDARHRTVPDDAAQHRPEPSGDVRCVNAP